MPAVGLVPGHSQQVWLQTLSPDFVPTFGHQAHGAAHLQCVGAAKPGAVRTTGQISPNINPPRPFRQSPVICSVSSRSRLR